MKTSLTAVWLTIGLALSLGMPAFGQDGQLAADIPFSFNVGDVKMASGRYIVQVLGSNALRIRCADYTTSAVTITNASIAPGDLIKGRLVFIRYGELRFLSEVSWPGGASRTLPKTDYELETAKSFGIARKLEVATK